MGARGAAVDVLGELAELLEAYTRQRRDHVSGRDVDVASPEQQAHPLQDVQHGVPVVVGALQGAGGPDAVVGLVSQRGETVHLRGHVEG